MGKVEEFHAHLDICAQCRNHPFNLCAEGVVLLQAAALGSVDAVTRAAKGSR